MGSINIQLSGPRRAPTPALSQRRLPSGALVSMSVTASCTRTETTKVNGILLQKGWLGEALRAQAKAPESRRVKGGSPDLLAPSQTKVSRPRPGHHLGVWSHNKRDLGSKLRLQESLQPGSRSSVSYTLGCPLPSGSIPACMMRRQSFIGGEARGTASAAKARVQQSPVWPPWAWI